MKVINFVRAVLVLVVAPPATLVVSLLALIFVGGFRCSASQVQVFPRCWGRLIAWLSGVRVIVEGREKLSPDRPYIFAANHQSQFDIFALQGYLGMDFRWLAKKELFQVPVFGPAMRMAGYIAIDRSRGRKALKSLDEAAGRIGAGTSVVIFPEGTRSPDGVLRPFKAGGMVLAIKAAVSIVPVAIIGTHAILPKGKLLVQPGTVTIRIGEPVDITEYTVRQKQQLAELLHDKVAALLGD